MSPVKQTVSREFVPTALKIQTPVPSDIVIAQNATLKPITQVAEEMGILPEELGTLWTL